MPELEEKKDQVTYARFDANETTDADYSRKLNQYVWENLPLTPEQKLEFHSLLFANAAGNGNGICNSSIDDDE
tara:strand:+ start:606 stop:824 length:219 start_codon:yes stop_codon:yes gene_type:complete